MDQQQLSSDVAPPLAPTGHQTDLANIEQTNAANDSNSNASNKNLANSTNNSNTNNNENINPIVNQQPIKMDISHLLQQIMSITNQSLTHAQEK